MYVFEEDDWLEEDELDALALPDLDENCSPLPYESRSEMQQGAVQAEAPGTVRRMARLAVSCQPEARKIVEMQCTKCRVTMKKSKYFKVWTCPKCGNMANYDSQGNVERTTDKRSIWGK